MSALSVNAELMACLEQSLYGRTQTEGNIFGSGRCGTTIAFDVAPE
jgi:hypothetical protein